MAMIYQIHNYLKQSLPLHHGKPIPQIELIRTKTIIIIQVYVCVSYIVVLITTIIEHRRNRVEGGVGGGRVLHVL